MAETLNYCLSLFTRHLEDPNTIIHVSERLILKNADVLLHQLPHCRLESKVIYDSPSNLNLEQRRAFFKAPRKEREK